MDVKQEMAKARELIEAKRYDEARRILERVDHPKAAEWLARLPASKPRPVARSGGVPGAVAIGGMVICLLLGGVGGFFAGREALRAEIAAALQGAFSGFNSSVTVEPSEIELTATAIININATRFAEATGTAAAP